MRAARAILGITQEKLAELAGVSVPTVQRMEAGNGVPRVIVDTMLKVIAALEKEGVVLIADHQPSTSGGRGIRLQSPPPT